MSNEPKHRARSFRSSRLWAGLALLVACSNANDRPVNIPREISTGGSGSGGGGSGGNAGGGAAARDGASGTAGSGGDLTPGSGNATGGSAGPGSGGSASNAGWTGGSEADAADRDSASGMVGDLRRDAASEGDVSDAGRGDGPGTDAPSAVVQTPPRGARVLDAWLAAGHYKTWHCEAKISEPRNGGVHGRVRICSNDLLSGHGAGPYPVGAASVKETYFGARIGQLTVGLKVAEGTAANTWYWYGQNELEGVGAPGCAGCHGRAPQYGGHDYVYFQVK